MKGQKSLSCLINWVCTISGSFVCLSQSDGSVQSLPSDQPRSVPVYVGNNFGSCIFRYDHSLLQCVFVSSIKKATPYLSLYTFYSLFVVMAPVFLMCWPLFPNTEKAMYLAMSSML